jgi:hypothetical protein
VKYWGLTNWVLTAERKNLNRKTETWKLEFDSGKPELKRENKNITAENCTTKGWIWKKRHKFGQKKLEKQKRESWSSIRKPEKLKHKQARILTTVNWTTKNWIVEKESWNYQQKLEKFTVKIVISNKQLITAVTQYTRLCGIIVSQDVFVQRKDSVSEPCAS